MSNLVLWILLIAAVAVGVYAWRRNLPAQEVVPALSTDIQRALARRNAAAAANAPVVTDTVGGQQVSRR